MKHTSEPWELNRNHEKYWGIEKQGIEFARVEGVLANALVIVMAPNLLKALKRLLDGCVVADSCGELSDYIDGTDLDYARCMIDRAEDN